jgi:hypothetical protein
MISQRGFQTFLLVLFNKDILLMALPNELEKYTHEYKKR